MHLVETHLDLPIKGHCYVVLASKETNNINLHGEQKCCESLYNYSILLLACPRSYMYLYTVDQEFTVNHNISEYA